MIKRIKCSLVGFRDHTGVENVGGRIGAAGGPVSFRQCFDRFSGSFSTRVELEDRGDVFPTSGDLFETLDRAAAKVQELHRDRSLSIVVGGGHDFGYSHLLGVRNALGPKARIGCINIDAHLDLRKSFPKMTSGSPFYLAIENKVIRPQDLCEFGIQPQCNGNSILEYAQEKKVKILTLDAIRGRSSGAVACFQSELKRLASVCEAVVVSFDLDAVSEAWAPGVSAPQSDGFNANEIFQMMTVAGAHSKVISLGLFELNPLHDRDQQTARLAATAAHRFLSAIEQRKSK